MIKAARIIGIVLILLGLLPGILGVYLYVRTARFIGTAKTAEGVVVELQHSGDVYHPVFSYTDDSGQEHTIHSFIGRNPPSYQEGEKLRIYYDPAIPKRAKIDSFFSLWFGVVICSAFAALPVFFGALFLLVVPMIVRAIVKDVKAIRREDG